MKKALKLFMKGKFYAFAEVVKASALILFFLWGLKYISETLRINLYPKSYLEEFILYSYIGFIFLGWLLGERKKTFLIFAYFATFQIIGFALILHDYHVILRILTPVFLTYLTLFLFKSPTEYINERIERENERIRREIASLQEKIIFYEIELEEIRKNYSQLWNEKLKLEKLLKENHSNEDLKKLLKEKEYKLQEYKEKLEELTQKIQTLRENNRQLWELLEESPEISSNKKKKDELKNLRKERKKLIKENLKLKNELEDTKNKLLLLKEELEEKKFILSNLAEKLENQTRILKEKEELIKKLRKKLSENIGKFIEALFSKVSFSPEAVEDFLDLPDNLKTAVLKTLRKLETTDINLANFEKVNTPKGAVFKERFSGGRVYFTLENGRIKILGILKGEDNKSKRRFISERFS